LWPNTYQYDGIEEEEKVLDEAAKPLQPHPARASTNTDKLRRCNDFRQTMQ